jgi:hypothetical protein
MNGMEESEQKEYTAGPVNLVKKMIRSVSFFYPLTFTGTLLFMVAVFLLGDAFNSKSLYSLIISISALMVLFYLAADARIQAFRLGGVQIVWDTSSNLTARMEGIAQKVHLRQAESRYFFRIHFILKGVLNAGRNAPLNIFSEHSVSGGGDIEIPLYFPVSGKFDAKGRLLVRDVFGLVRARISEDEHRALSVRPPVFPLLSTASVRSVVNEESSKKRQSSEAEKYYMREYMPGDRMKDINWKASLRVYELITRISPVSPEPSRMIHIELRHYRIKNKDSASSVIHLNYLKSQLLSFLTVLKQQYPEYRFRIITADGPRLIETMSDLERFAVYLGGLGFESPGRFFNDPDTAVKEKFIFITCYDDSLINLPGVVLHVYRTALKSDLNQKVRRIAFFSRSREGVSSLSLAFPGMWIFRPDRPGKAASSGGFRTLTEEKISVRLI